MRGVADDGEVGYASAQFDRYLPHGQVTVDGLVVAGEASVYGSQFLYACAVETFESTYPQLEVRVHGVLHEHRDVDAAQRVGEGLHGEGVGAGACSHPHDVDAVFHCQLDVSGCCHLGGDEHSRLLLDLLEPLEGRFAVSLEASWLGARLPHSCTEHVASLLCQLLGCFHHLFFCLCAARTCYDEWSFLVAWQLEFF